MLYIKELNKDDSECTILNNKKLNYWGVHTVDDLIYVILWDMLIVI